MIESYRDLKVWQSARQLVKDVYCVTREFPSDERFGLTNQMRRAAVSIPSNIAEGHARRSRQEFLRFLSYALGSAAELDTQILLSGDLDYITVEVKDRLTNHLAEVGRMLRGLEKALQRTNP